MIKFRLYIFGQKTKNYIGNVYRLIFKCETKLKSTQFGHNPLFYICMYIHIDYIQDNLFYIYSMYICIYAKILNKILAN